MKYIRVSKESINSEHFCCAVSNKDDVQVSSKKEWLKSCFKVGLMLLKCVERKKIEK